MIRTAGIELTHVAYKGNAPALNDLLGGHVEVMFVSPSFGRPYVHTGRLRALGIAGPRRLPTLPDLPTFHSDSSQNMQWDGRLDLAAALPAVALSM